MRPALTRQVVAVSSREVFVVFLTGHCCSLASGCCLSRCSSSSCPLELVVASVVTEVKQFSGSVFASSALDRCWIQPAVCTYPKHLFLFYIPDLNR
jgi:hypothetical protein